MQEQDEITPTLFFLSAQFKFRPCVPIEEVGSAYFGHEAITARKKARENKYPFPTFKNGSKWMVKLTELAKHLDKESAKAAKQYKLAN